MACESNIPSDIKNLGILQKNIEEQDSRIKLHVFQASIIVINTVFVLSSDTDVSRLLLYYWFMFQEKSLLIIHLWVYL